MIYVMSDIHGNISNFKSIMNQINLQSSDTLYILGDVIDRYPYGIEILNEIIDKPNIKMLLGNHEYMMLNALTNKHPSSKKRDLILWYQNSGKITHEAFLKLDKQKQEKIITYLESLPINIDITVGTTNYKLVHASPIELYNKDFYYRYRDEIEFAVWNRILYKNDSDRVIIFGHTTTNRFQTNKPLCICFTKHMIAIDCGSGHENELFGGRLACLRLDDMKEYYSK